MAAVKKATAVKAESAKTTTKKASTKTVTFDDISKRAFEIYVSNGGSTSAEQNWIQAEKELSK